MKNTNKAEKILIIANKFKNLSLLLNERTTRLRCAIEAVVCGRGGIQAVYEATGVSRTTITRV